MRRFLSSISVSAGQTIVSGVAGLLLTRMFIQAFGIELYGVWVTCAAWTAYLSLTQMGIATAVGIRVARDYAAERTTEASEVLSTACVTLSAVAVLATLVVLTLASSSSVVGWFFKTSDLIETRTVATIFALVSASFLVGLPAEGFRSALRWLNRIDAEQSLILAARLLGLSLAWMSLRLFRSPAAFLGSQIIAAVCLSLAIYLCFRYFFPTLRFRIRGASWPVLRALLPSSGSFLVIGASGSIIWSTDPIVIAAVVSAADVTPYALTVRVIQLATVLIAVLTGAALPLLARLATEDEGQRKHVFLHLLRLTTFCSVGGVILMAFFAQSFVTLWVGFPSFVSTPTFYVLLATFALRSFAMAAEGIVVTSGGERNYGKIVAFEAVLNLTMSLALAPTYGVFGVALGTFVAHVAATGWYLPRTAQRITAVDVSTVLRTVFVPLVLPVLAAVAVASIMGSSQPSWPRFLVFVSCTAGVYMVAWMCFSANEMENAVAHRLLYRFVGVSGADSHK